ncbi:MAG TPA: NADH-quinone oxidoreductase subunit N [Candidatus Acidoferrum sp.]|nr:NADH-quinone oxidoreductase subunit N [Candidatus Acidoferrum sp.]
MGTTDFTAILPLLIVASAAVAVMLDAARGAERSGAAGWTILGLAVSLGTLPFASAVSPRQVTPLLRLDGYALLYIGLILAAALAVAALSTGYLARRGLPQGEYHVLLLLATLGSAVLVSSSHYASFFLGLELLSVSLYALIAYPRSHRRPLEAGVKYLVLAGASSAFLLFGMALTYAETGTMEFARIGSILSSEKLGVAYMLAGLGLMLTGIGFKLAVVPFHMWTPDVYEGAPAPVTAFVATVSKGAMFALLLRFFAEANAYGYSSVTLGLGVIAVASMLAGNLLALLQDNIKRILAYSSIAHLGYLLVAFLAAGQTGVEAVTFYLVAYFVTMLGAFGVVTVLSTEDRDADIMEDYRGLFWRRPALALTFTAMLLSLAGIPLTAGFVGKFFVLSAAVGSALWIPVFVLVVGSAIGLFYYLRIVVAVFAEPEEGVLAGVPSVRLLTPVSGLALVVLTLLLLWFGVYPAPLIRLIQSVVGSLS